MKLALALLLLAVSARAEVREIKSMAEIIPSLDTSTLLVFDIDNTLVEPVGQLGSDQWYYYLVKAIARDDASLSADAAEEKAGAVWTRTLSTVKVKAVEALSPDLIRAQQKRGLKVMALTARSTDDAPATFAQLEAIGVDMAESAPYTKDLTTGNKGLYTRGVFFQGEGPSKGATLAAFLKTIGLAPKKVVFADDKAKHTKSVNEALTAAGIPVIAFRYGATDAKVAAFNDFMAEAATKTASDLLFHGIEPAKK